MLAGAPAQHCAHVRDELDRIHRLGEVVIGSGVEPAHPVRRRGVAGDQDDRQPARARVLAQQLENAQAVHAWHVPVEEHHAHSVVAQMVEEAGTVGDGRRMQARVVEDPNVQLACHRVVVDDEEVGHVVRRLRRRAPARGEPGLSG